MTQPDTSLIGADLERAYSECRHYNDMGGLDDEVIADIAHDYKVSFDLLKAKCEEGL
jgi:hypothetical protein